MILTRVPGGLLVVRQTDHGTQTGRFAEAWGNEAVAPPEGASDAVLAAHHHDDGWAVWERRPTIDPATSQPVQFLALTPFEHVPLYRAGIARAAQHSPSVGLLVSMHGAGLYNGRYGTMAGLDARHLSESELALVREFLADMEALQDRLATAGGHGSFGPERHACDDPEVRRRYFLLQVWDRLSLQYAWRLAGDGSIAPLPGSAGGSGVLECRNDGRFALVLDPYPFCEDRMTFPVTGVVVADRSYLSPEDFLATVAATTPVVVECRARAA
ncbi:MAG: DUF3891 family protein [Acidimicrobiales bacterium]